jgi:Tol biopolymer transport system component
MLVRTAILCVAALAPAAAQSTTRVSVDSAGVQAAGGSWVPSCSGDGRFIGFQSDAPNLVTGDTNGAMDVFLHDRANGSTRILSIDRSGGPADGPSFGPRVSTDGRFVAFCSNATDLVTGDLNGVRDVFVRDRLSHSTVRVSVDSSGGEANGASATAIFQGYGQVHHSPYAIDISADGRVVAFESAASNLVAGDTNAKNDIFVHDLASGLTERVSVHASGAQNPLGSSFARISGDGQRVLFWTSGQLVAGDQNTEIDSYVRDRAAATTLFASAPFGAAQSIDPSFALDLSADGRFAMFTSDSHALTPPPYSTHTEIFVRDLALGVTSVVSTTSSGAFGNNYSGLDLQGAISADGRYVLFDSYASNFVAGDTNSYLDLFVKDVLTGAIERVNVTATDGQVNGIMRSCALSDDGRIVAFHAPESIANLVAGDSNGAFDVIVRDRASTVRAVTSYCTAKTNSAGCAPVISTSGEPRLSGYDAFFVSATGVLSQQRGTFFWSALSGAVPFGGGWRCVLEPLARTPSQTSGGNTASVDCTGSYSFHFDQSYMASLSVVAGVPLYGQFWSRDPGFAWPNDVGLSNAIMFTPAP